MNNIRKYIFGLTEMYLKYVNPRYKMKSSYILDIIKDNPPKRTKNGIVNEHDIQRRNQKFLTPKINGRKINIENENEESEAKNLSLFNKSRFKSKEKIRDKDKKNFKILTSITSITSKKMNITPNDKDKDNKINLFMKKYLSTSEDDMDYDNALEKDKRQFFNFLWERMKVNSWFINIIFSDEQLRPRTIRILIVILNIDLYFLVNGLYFNEDYISEVYHSAEKEHFFDFIYRTNYNLFYASMVGAIIEYMISCFFVEEQKLKNLFRREKNNELNLRPDFSNLLNVIKLRYIAFFITSYIITIFTWYYVSCFNNVYPNMKIEWIKSSVFIMIVMIFVYILLSLLETILRFLSFKCKSEQLYKLSKIFSNCC